MIDRTKISGNIEMYKYIEMETITTHFHNRGKKNGNEIWMSGFNLGTRL